MYKKQIIVILFFIILIVGQSLYSQEKYHISKDNADCENAIVLEDTIFGPTNAPEGYGKVMEITADKDNKYYFEKEHNTVWYKFTTPQTCVLTFEIIPEDIRNDYDFLLFKYTDSSFCRDVKNKKIKPVRSNISRNDPGINSVTGLSKSADVDFVRSGPGEQFSRALNVNEGETYYLVLDNVYDNGSGHTLNLHYSECEVQAPKDKYSTDLDIYITDSTTGLPLRAFVELYLSKLSSAKKAQFQADSVSHCKFKLDNRQRYYLQIYARGYLNYTEEIIIPRGYDVITDSVKLPLIEVGKNFNIENILFEPGLDKFLPASKYALEHILRFMKLNPTVKIEIQGHVNYPTWGGTPGKSESDKLLKLSEDRAKAVYNFLVKQGISEERLTSKGYGNTRMLYPDTQNPLLQEKNRRVEIEILSY